MPDKINLNTHTPEEAAKKWCPLVRNLFFHENISQGERPHVATSYNADRNHNKCISTNCALWVQDTPRTGCCGATNAALLG